MNDLSAQLFRAIQVGDVPGCLALLVRGADIEAPDKHGDHPLHLAIANAHPSICLILLEYGANVNAAGKYKQSPLHVAAWFDYVNICLLLLEHGADPQLKDGQGKTALDLAIEDSCSDCADIIRSWLTARAARAVLAEISAGKVVKEVAP